MKKIVTRFMEENGWIHRCGGTVRYCDAAWAGHPVFEGVALRHLVTAADTDGALSCHVVRIDPGRRLDMHRHEAQLELHEVVEGAGWAEIEGRRVEYAPGVAAVIPKGAGHSVNAGDEGLVLFAKFAPALL